MVTASTGAAIRDIMNISHRRNPYVQLILYPAKVQGDGAAESIAMGIERLDQLGVDVIIAGRGGGSIEDLWAFNEEIVARAIFSCNTPVISAVGHETDVTIADYVADLRAPRRQRRQSWLCSTTASLRNSSQEPGSFSGGGCSGKQRRRPAVWSSTGCVCASTIPNGRSMKSGSGSFLLRTI